MSNSDLFVSAAYVLYVVAPAIRDELWLRVALFFNSFGFAIWGLWIGSWPVVVANVLFCFMSLRQMHRAWLERRPADLPGDVLALGEALFPGMHARDLEALWDLGAEYVVGFEELTRLGDANEELFIVMDGSVEVELADGLRVTRTAPTVVGEVTLLNPDIAGATATVHTLGARLWRCPKAAVIGYQTDQPRFAAAFIGGLSTEMASRVLRTNVPHIAAN